MRPTDKIKDGFCKGDQDLSEKKKTGRKPNSKGSKFEKALISHEIVDSFLLPTLRRET